MFIIKYIVAVIIAFFILFPPGAFLDRLSADKMDLETGINLHDSALQCDTVTPVVFSQEDIRKLFLNTGLEGYLDYPVFERAVKGYLALPVRKNDVLTIIDFSKESTEERLFIIDMKSHELLMETLVSHGKNTGQDHATSFSNKRMSLKSSPGFYLTGESYQGRHGYSLKLDGQEKGINDNARSRAIVLHGASYVSYEFIEDYGRLGRSWGCPAVPLELTKEIIDKIKGGSCFYIHTDDPDYLDRSSFY